MSLRIPSFEGNAGFVCISSGLETLLASLLVSSSFYVDDLLTGGGLVEAAKSIQEDLNQLLAEGGMLLHNWRSNSADLLNLIPEDLQEKSGQTIAVNRQLGGKTLGIHWDTQQDVFHIPTPSVDKVESPTKREVASAGAHVYDILG